MIRSARCCFAILYHPPIEQAVFHCPWVISIRGSLRACFGYPPYFWHYGAATARRYSLTIFFDDYGVLFSLCADFSVPPAASTKILPHTAASAAATPTRCNSSSRSQDFDFYISFFLLPAFCRCVHADMGLPPTSDSSYDPYNTMDNMSVFSAASSVVNPSSVRGIVHRCASSPANRANTRPCALDAG